MSHGFEQTFCAPLVVSQYAPTFYLIFLIFHCHIRVLERSVTPEGSIEWVDQVDRLSAPQNLSEHQRFNPHRVHFLEFGKRT